MRERRGESEGHARRQELLAQIAAKRKEQQERRAAINREPARLDSVSSSGPSTAGGHRGSAILSTSGSYTNKPQDILDLEDSSGSDCSSVEDGDPHPSDSGDRTAGSSAADVLSKQLATLEIASRQPLDDLPEFKEVHGAASTPAEPAGASGAEQSPSASSGEPASAEAGDLVLGETSQFRLPGQVASTLYPHQVEGVKWLWSLQEAGKGGILADDMGLGKTMQVSAFLRGLLHSGLIRRALVVAPKTLLQHWSGELARVGLRSCVHEYAGSQRERERVLGRVWADRSVLLTTYGMVLHNQQALSEHSGARAFDGDGQPDVPLWDLVVCDEGHQLRNAKAQTTERLRAVPARLRVLITGTPIQNNLMELHTLMGLCCPALLGTAKSFKLHFTSTMTAGQSRTATDRERAEGVAMSAQLRRMIAPHFLRREKSQVLGVASAAATSAGSASSTASSRPCSGSAAPDASRSGTAAPAPLGAKKDLVVWLQLTAVQKEIYQAFLRSKEVAAVLNQTCSPVAAITVLKKVCGHPALLNDRALRLTMAGIRRARARAAKGAAAGDGKANSSCLPEEVDRGEEDECDAEAAAAKMFDGWVNQAAGAPGTLAIEQLTAALQRSEGVGVSAKTSFVLKLLRQLTAEGHRTLLFSQSRVMINILEAAVAAEGLEFCRIDGSVPTLQRQQAVQRFQTRSDIPVFLLTTQVGGLGLTLTAADRVVVMDPSWNPALDDQSVDRAYRIGQKRNVVVYRLMTCGTVEEKMYQNQVFKGSLARLSMGEKTPYRYFTTSELRDLFTVTPEGLRVPKTQQYLAGLSRPEARADSAELQQHQEWLEGCSECCGLSDHDLLYARKATDTASVPDSLHESREPAAGCSRAPPQRVPLGRAGAKELGPDALSKMLSRSLTLANPTAPDPAARRQHRASELAAEVARKKVLLQQLQGKLPDSGRRLAASLASMEAELEQLRQQTRPQRGTADRRACAERDSAVRSAAAVDVCLAEQQPTAESASSSGAAARHPDPAGTGVHGPAVPSGRKQGASPAATLRCAASPAEQCPDTDTADRPPPPASNTATGPTGLECRRPLAELAPNLAAPPTDAASGGDDNAAPPAPDLQSCSDQARKKQLKKRVKWLDVEKARLSKGSEAYRQVVRELKQAYDDYLKVKHKLQEQAQ